MMTNDEKAELVTWQYIYGLDVVPPAYWNPRELAKPSTRVLLQLVIDWFHDEHPQ